MTAVALGFALVVSGCGDDGALAYFSASDGVPEIAFTAQPGMLCRELLASDPTLDGWKNFEPATFIVAVAYWFLEDERARMDADGDGIPCEQLFTPGVVQDVWAGNP